MASAVKLSVALTRDMAVFVRAAVDSSEYASSSEGIREALRDWKRRRDLEQQQIEELRRLRRDGVNSGSARTLDMEEIKNGGANGARSTTPHVTWSR
jgi:antitoxin ParD1/3/4